MFYHPFHATLRPRGRLLLLVSAGVISVIAPMGTFANPPSFAPMVNYSNAGGFDVTTADVTGDNILDLITVGASIYGFKVLPGNGTGGVGDGTFGSPQNYTSGFGPGLAVGQFGVIARDFNNDLKQDIAIANRYTENVSISINNGSGCNTAVLYPLFASSSPRAVTTGYFNNDSVLDLAVADFGIAPPAVPPAINDNSNSRWVSVLLGSTTTPGTFLPEIRYYIGPYTYGGLTEAEIGQQPHDIVAADFNQDGKTDLATANVGGDDESVLLGNGDGTFQTGVHYRKTSLLGCVSEASIDAGNLNAGTYPDIVAGCSTSPRGKILLNKDDGTFWTTSPPLAFFETPYRVRDVKLGDLNNDGILDLAAAVSENGGVAQGGVSVFEGNNDGTFQIGTNYSTGDSYVTSVALADFNGDGLKDIAVANLSLNTVSVFINNFIQNHPVPTLSSISPTSAYIERSFTLTAIGTFVPGSVVKLNGDALTTTFASTTQLTATVSPSDFTSAGSYAVTVFTPTPGGGTSDAQTLIALNLPAPTLSSISPTNAVVGAGAFTLTLTGTDFVGDSVIKWNGASLTTTYNSSAQLTATVPASNLTSVGTASITVFTPGPGGGTSNAINLTISSDIPVSADIPALSSPGVMTLVVLLLLGGSAAARRYRRW